MASSASYSLTTTAPQTVAPRAVECLFIDAYNTHNAVTYVNVQDGDVAASRRAFAVPAGAARSIRVEKQCDTSLVVWASNAFDGTTNPGAALNLVVAWGPATP